MTKVINLCASLAISASLAACGAAEDTSPRASAAAVEIVWDNATTAWPDYAVEEPVTRNVL